MMGKQKFRDPKTGEVLDTIGSVWKRVCTYPNNICSCSLFKKTKCDRCFAWCADHHSEAATLMGYEVIEDEKEVNMEKNDKRLSEWTLRELSEHCDAVKICGECRFNKTGKPCPFGTIPSLWPLNEMAPRLTEAELAIMRATGTRWVSRDGNSVNRVELWTTKPGHNGNYIYSGAENEFVARFNCTLFPSVHPGDCIEAEVTGE